MSRICDGIHSPTDISTANFANGFRGNGHEHFENGLFVFFDMIHQRP